jgi:DNA-binding transcriptional regulator YdaS (Cro superfamily)
MSLLSPDRALTADRRELRVLHESLPAVGRDDALRSEVAGLVGLYRESIAATLRGHGYAEAISSALAATIAAAVDGAVLQQSLDPDFDVSPIADILTSAMISQRRT